MACWDPSRLPGGGDIRTGLEEWDRVLKDGGGGGEGMLGRGHVVCTDWGCRATHRSVLWGRAVSLAVGLTAEGWSSGLGAWAAALEQGPGFRAAEEEVVGWSGLCVWRRE